MSVRVLYVGDNNRLLTVDTDRLAGCAVELQVVEEIDAARRRIEADAFDCVLTDACFFETHGPSLRRELSTLADLPPLLLAGVPPAAADHPPEPALAVSLPPGDEPLDPASLATQLTAAVDAQPATTTVSAAENEASTVLPPFTWLKDQFHWLRLPGSSAAVEDVPPDLSSADTPPSVDPAADSATEPAQPVDTPADTPTAEPADESTDEPAAASEPAAYCRPADLWLSPGSSTLVVCASHDSRKHDACLDLLATESATNSHVLLVRYSRLSPDRLERIVTQAAATTLIEIGYSQPIPETLSDRIERFSIRNPNDLTRLGIVATGIVSEWATLDADIRVCVDQLSLLYQYKSTKRIFRFLHILLAKLAAGDAVSHFHVDTTSLNSHAVETIVPLFDSVLRVDTNGVRLD